jgi:TAT (twin-arginine translocation) pathway signal sequence
LNDNQPVENESEKSPDSKISRREFLKYGAGVAAVAVGATALMGRIPLPENSPRKTPASNDSSEAIVATVEGNQVTVMNGQKIVKTNDSGLAAQIADKVS